MKTIITAIIIAASLAGCNTISDAELNEMRSRVSWQAFCLATGHDIDDNTFLTINQYLDAWVGSADEENALIAAGIKPY